MGGKKKATTIMSVNGTSGSPDAPRNNARSNENAGLDGSCSSSRPLSIQGPQPEDTTTQGTFQPISNQPRQPTNLQGLLRFAMEATRSEDVPRSSQFQPLDEERKSFLNEALSSMAVNTIEELQKAIAILSGAGELRLDDDPSDYEAALERIGDFVDNMDIANDFYKIGGFAIFPLCLNSSHSGLRWRAADIIAELSQNNPFCQKRVLEAGLLPTLLNMVDADPSEQTRIKALYAVSCIVREQPSSLVHMEMNDGYSVLLRAIQSPTEKLQIKSAFLLSSLCNKENSEALKMTLVNMGLVEQVAGLLAMGNLVPDTREQLLRVLYGLTNNNDLMALKECQRPELYLRQTLERYLKVLTSEDTSLDEVDVCKGLLDKIFSENETCQER